MPTQEKLKKRTSSCPSLGCSSCSLAECNDRQIPVSEIVGVTSVCPSDDVVSHVVTNVKDEKQYKTRFLYNKSVVPSQVDALLAARRHKCQVSNTNTIRSRVFGRTVKQTNAVSFHAGCVMSEVAHNDLGHPSVHSNKGVDHGAKCHDIDVVQNSPQKQTAIETPGFESKSPGFEPLISGFESCDCDTKLSMSGCAPGDVVIAEPSGQEFESSHVTDSAAPMYVGQKSSKLDNVSVGKSELTSSESLGPGFESGVKTGIITKSRPSVNAVTDEVNQLCPIYDVNNVGMEDKFVNTIIFANQGRTDFPQGVNTPIFNQWQSQVDFQFGFVPLGCQLMPSSVKTVNSHDYSPIEMHQMVRKTGKPNFLQARLPVASQLNVDKWQSLLTDYWDQQLLQLLQFGFPLDFNRGCPLKHEAGNHSSADEFPSDVDAYIEEECKFGALLGPFHLNPIENAHNSPFMTRHKPNSDRRRVIIDLSWPLGASVNSGIDKNTYLDAPFTLTFPTVDDITSELKRLGRGALLYKIDVSRAFRHVKVDPGDYDLLGLHWRHAYVDTCVPFGTRHGSQIFQRLSDAVRYIMRQRGFRVIDYIDDYVGFGVPSVARASFASLFELMQQLGLTVSDKKLVPPSTKVVCLGVLIDTENGTVSIPPEKLRQINDMVKEWLSKTTCTKRQLQSLLGLLLYVHKCVKPARAFLNRMLALLRSGHANQKIELTSDFRRDLRWFGKFLPLYNGISLYDHRPVDFTLELDACLTGLGGRWSKFVYHLPIVRGFMNFSIVHLEMVNILLAVRLFQVHWSGRKVLVKCDNEAVVSVLRSGRTRDPYLGACARNIWYVSALADIDLQYVHIRGVDNGVADLLSRWIGSPSDFSKLLSHIQDPVWVSVNEKLLDIDPEL